MHRSLGCTFATPPGQGKVVLQAWWHLGSVVSEKSEPLPSGPLNCRYCGKAMTKGYVQGETDAIGPATIAWYDPESRTGGRLAPLGHFAWNESPMFPAYICGDCGVIEFRPVERPPAKSTESRS